MKNNELQIFEKSPPGWTRTTLGEILPISYGKSLPKAKRDENGRCPVYGSSGQVGQHSEALTKKPALIIGRKGSVGVVHYSQFPCWPIDTVYFVEEKEDLNLKFFEYLLKGINLRKLDKSTAVPGLSRDDYNAVEVAIAPLYQQKLIVAEIEKQFSRLDEAVANLKRVKANLKRYKAAVLKAAVEGKLTEEWRAQNPDVEPASELLKRILAERRKKWEEAELAKMKAKGKVPKHDKWKKKYREPSPPDVANITITKLPEGWVWASVPQLGDTRLGKMLDKKKNRSGTKLPYLRNINVRWGSIATDNVMEMYFNDGELDKYDLAIGDVLVCEGGEPGRASVWDGRLQAMKFQKALHRVRFSEAYEGDLLVILLEFLAKSGQLERWFTGSTIKHFTGESFASLPVPVPPIEEQCQILEEVQFRLSYINELENEVNTNLKRSERLRQSILKKAFSGGLIFNGPKGNTVLRNEIGPTAPLSPFSPESV